MEASLGSDREAGPSTGPAMAPAPPDSHLAARYKPLKLLDEGVYGFVVLAHNMLSGEQVAIKFVECK